MEVNLMKKTKVFVIMPFDTEFFESYEALKKEFHENCEFSHAGEEGNQQNILQDIIAPIYNSDIILADLTSENSNVLYELGVAHALNKKTIVITKDELSDLPFDLKQYRARNYNMNYDSFSDLIEYLKINFDGAINNTIAFSNPVKDFLKLSDLDFTNWFNETENSDFDSENGFLDFLCEIEKNIKECTEIILELTADMNTMTTTVKNSNESINKNNQRGGSGTAFLNKKESEKVATAVDTFDISLRNVNDVFPVKWDKIEVNTIGLLENDITKKPENKTQISNFLKSFETFKKNVTTAVKPVITFKETLRGIEGLQKNLTVASKALQRDLDIYINVMNQSVSSIDKILFYGRKLID